MVQIRHMLMGVHQRFMSVNVLMPTCHFIVKVNVVVMVPVSVVVFMIVLDREVLMFVRVRATQHEGDTDRGDQE